MNIDSILKVVRGIVRIRGNSDNTLIGNVGDSLSVINNNTESTPGSPVFTKFFKSIFSDTDIVLSGAYQTAFTYTGSGKFIGCVLGFSGKGAQVRFTIDSVELFDIALADLVDSQVDIPFTTGGGPTSPGDSFLFEPSYPIVYSTSILIEITGPANRSLVRSIVNLTEDS